MTNYFSNVLGTDKYSPYEHPSANIPVEDEALNFRIPQKKN